MELTAVSATQFSVAQLTTILCDCFEDYLVPVTLSVEVFVQRFSAEGLSLLDSCVWLDGDVPAAMAVVARRGDEARLAAFAMRPAYRGKGVGRRLMGSLLDALREQGVRRMWLEVIRDNHAAVALYRSLGFEIRRGLGREMLMTLARQFPGLGTSVTIPERFTPLFQAAGYTPGVLKQYEMSATLSALPSAGR